MLLRCEPNSELDLRSSLLGRLDPEFVNKKSISDACREFEVEFKANLLFSERLFIPCGFIFDNPYFHHFFGTNRELVDLLLDFFDNDTTSLIIGVDSESSGRLSPDDLFVIWLYGKDGGRPNRPCTPGCLKVPGVEERLRSGAKRYDFHEYFQQIYPNHETRRKDIRRIIEGATHVSYPEDRHAIYKKELMGYFSKLVYEGKSINDNQEFLNHIESNKKISRSEIKEQFPRIWKNNFHQLIHLRQKSYFGGSSGAFSSAFPSFSRPFDFHHKNSEIIKSIFLKEGNGHRIMIDALTFEDIRRIRQIREFKDAISGLSGEISSADGEGGQLFEYMRDVWVGALFRAVGKINKDALVDCSDRSTVASKSIVHGASFLSGMLATVSPPVAAALAAVAFCVDSMYSTKWNAERCALIKFRREVRLAFS